MRWLVWSASVLVFYLVAGVDPAQPLPPPMLSGPIIAVLASVILLISAGRFFGRSGSERSRDE